MLILQGSIAEANELTSAGDGATGGASGGATACIEGATSLTGDDPTTPLVPRQYFDFQVGYYGTNLNINKKMSCFDVFL